MIYLGYIVIVFTAIQLIVAVVNIVFKQKMGAMGSNEKLVSVLIPARNEEKNILNILRDISSQNYYNYEVIVFDDQSTDSTVKIVTEYMQKDKNIRLIASEGLPNGWLGKNHACHSLALEAKGDYYLFVDADVRIKRNIIGETLRFAQKHTLNLVSVFPKQTLKSWGEWATVPIMNYILLTLLPLILVRKIGLSSIAAANGQYMFFDAKNYRNLLPHEAMKSEKVEDIKIARHYKQKHMNVACLASETDVRCNMYNSYSESVNGFSKNVTTFFGGSTLLAIFFWLISTFGFIPILLLYGTRGLTLYLVAVLIIRLLVSMTSKQSVSKNIIYLLAQQISLGLIIMKSIQHKLNKKHIWKGRNILQS